MEARLRGVDLTALEHIHSGVAATLFTGHLWNERMIRRDADELLARAASSAHPLVDARAENATLCEMRDALRLRYALRREKEGAGGPSGLPSRVDALKTYLSWVEEARKDLPPESETAIGLDKTINDINAMIGQVG
jgi:hypothetical protein